MRVPPARPRYGNDDPPAAQRGAPLNVAKLSAAATRRSGCRACVPAARSTGADVSEYYQPSKEGGRCQRSTDLSGDDDDDGDNSCIKGYQATRQTEVRRSNRLGAVRA
jgi:hypothetical protein